MVDKFRDLLVGVKLDPSDVKSVKQTKKVSTEEKVLKIRSDLQSLFMVSSDLQWFPSWNMGVCCG